MGQLLPGTVYAIVHTPPSRLRLETFASTVGAHPVLVRRLVRLGLLDAGADASGELWFDPGQLSAFGRLQRLRAELSLNYAALGLVVELLDRIADLERAPRRGPPRTTSPHTAGGQQWTPTA
ncbi:chaperone modulator CbpM [Actinomadura terrae]|uniref:chaperone modulator CbpM n=1 Tax=Actinomadura terrae TaxID=604353 RepID=UPI001FA738D0|nr:chaperone modulator CbpM [Actinomadura terrae]